MAKPQLLLLGEIQRAHQEFKSLQNIADIIEPKSRCRAEFLEECRNGALDSVLVVYRTFSSVAITGLLDNDLIEALPRNLKFICHSGAGYDQVDVQACTKRGIRVSHVPTAVDDATADTTIFLILGALRGLNGPMMALRNGHWRGGPPPPYGHDPQDKVLGILGMGGIGKNLMRKALAFGMHIQYHNRHKLSEEQSGRAKYVGFDELLTSSDVLSLNLPLNKQTHHLISRGEFDKMKKGIIIINTARGAIIDEEALVEALNSGRVASCGLDVYEDEPKVHEGLIANPNVMLLPHLGTWTEETCCKMEEWNLRNVRSVVEEGKLISPVPEQWDM